MARRFIAGAICPKCGESDTTYVEKGAEPETRHCVGCGFSDARPSDVPESSMDEWHPVRLPGEES